MRTSLLMVLALLLTLGCTGSGESTTHSEATDSGAPTQTAAASEPAAEAPPISLDPADLQALSSWEQTSQASAKLTTMLADIMSQITDAKSAEAAIAKLDELAPKFAAVARAEKALGEPSDDERKLVLKNLAEANQLFDKHFTPIVENEEINGIVGEAIDRAYLGEE